MKNIKRPGIDGPPKGPPKKYRVKNGTDIYYSFSHWTGTEIDGVVFLAVCKQYPSQDKTQMLHYVRKDSLELIK
jgi:hypothetical protein